jgi:hypothetical protein
VTATPSASPSASLSTPVVAYAPRCTAAALRLGKGERVSEGTGQRPISLTLTNVSSRGCHVLGYPGVSYVDSAGRVLPFRYVWGGDQMVTSKPPARVDLPPGGVAYIAANKYRCDMADLARATAVRVILPDERVALQLALDVSWISYCGAGDPGSSVFVSPVEPDYVSTTSLN